MEKEVILLAKCRYQKEGMETKKSYVSYYPCNKESISKRDNYKGYTEFKDYRQDDKLFTDIPDEFLGRMCNFRYDIIPAVNSSSRMFTKLVEVSCNGKVVSLA